MATVTKPIALDESINTTEQTPRNIADVLAEELARIAENILPPNAEDIAYDNTESGLTATNVQDAIDEVISSQADVIADTMADLTENKTATVTDGVADFETIDGSLVKSLVVEIEPSQSGYTQEDVTVEGKNRLPFFTEVKQGATCIVQPLSNGRYDFYGTATGSTAIQYTINNLNLNGVYRFVADSYVEQSGSNITLYYHEKSGGDTKVLYPNETIDLTVNEITTIAFFVSRGTTINYRNIGLMLVPSTETDLSFEPYHGKTYTTQFGQSITAGGTLDFLTGELTTGGQSISLTPQKVKSLVGENHIMASTGDVLECKYSMLINGDDLAQIIGG